MRQLDLLLATSSGSLFETFDFYLFALFSVAISQSFFGEVSDDNMLWVFVIFASGYFARIIGAMLFGYLGDKHGRSLSFRYTILTISFTSIAIGIIPTYSTIGIFAIILLFILRIAQGVAYGGGLSCAIVLIYEHTYKHRGLYCSIVLVFASLGVVVANLIHTSVVTWMNPNKILDLGWRVAFVGSGLIVFHCYYYAKQTLKEPLVFREMQQSQKTKRNSIRKIAKDYKGLLICVFFTQAGIASYWGILVAYLPTYCAEYCSLSTIWFSQLFLVMSIGIAIGNIAGGIIADKLGIRKAYLSYSVLMVIIILPTFHYAFKEATPITNILVAMGVLAFLTGLMNGTTNYFTADLFPTKIRYTGVSVCLSLSMAFFAGLAPLYVSILTDYFDNPMIPAQILTVAYIIQVIAVIVIIIFGKQLKVSTEA